MVADVARVQRTTVGSSTASDVFLVGQALGSETQRLSGLPYTLPEGRLSQSGRALDGFLRQFGYTIDSSAVSQGRLRYAYASDLVQRYTGRNARGEGDRKPIRAEMDNCAEWLEEELLLVHPKVVLLLGMLPAKEFLKRYGARSHFVWGKVYRCEVVRHKTVAVPIYHPSYRRRKPDATDDLYRSVARKVRRILE